MNHLRTAIVFLGLCVCVNVWAEKTADEHYQDESWRSAAKAYADLVKEQPNNGRAWYRLAVSQRYLQRYKKALSSLKQAEQVGVPISFVGYERANTLASSGDDEGAIESLQAAADAGLNTLSQLEEKALDSIRDTPQFERIEKIVARNAAPCSVDEHHGDFNFWIGEWQVVDANGNIQGNNVITKAENDCLLIENWTSAAGNTGQSMNYYDPHSNKWYQRWVSAGALINLEGEFSEGAMRLVGDIYYYGNKNYSKFRGTWTPLEDGRVRQFFEQSTDDGNSWQPWFDGYYSKSKSED